MKKCLWCFHPATRGQKTANKIQLGNVHPSFSMDIVKVCYQRNASCLATPPGWRKRQENLENINKVWLQVACSGHVPALYLVWSHATFLTHMHICDWCYFPPFWNHILCKQQYPKGNEWVLFGRGEAESVCTATWTWCWSFIKCF